MGNKKPPQHFVGLTVLSSTALAVVGAWYLYTHTGGKGIEVLLLITVGIFLALWVAERRLRQQRADLGTELIMRYGTLAAMTGGIFLTGPTPHNPFLAGYAAYVTVGAIRRGYAGGAQSVAMSVILAGIVFWAGGHPLTHADLLSLTVMAAVLIWVAFTVSVAAEQGFRTQERLTQSEARYHSLFEIAPLPVLVIDLQMGTIAEANPRFWQLLGRDPAEKPLWLIQDALPDPALWSPLLEELQSGQPFWDREAELVGRVFLLSGHQLDHGGRRLGVVVMQDLSEQIALENARQMETLGAVAGGVAHEFNNLLAGVVGHGSVLLAEHPELRADLAPMVAAGEKGARLARQLLAFTEHSPGMDRAESPLAALFGEVAEIFGRTLGREYPPVELNLPEVYVAVPEAPLRGALLDLLVHAHRQGATQIRVEAELQTDEMGNPWAVVRLAHDGRLGRGPAGCPWCGLERVARLVEAFRGVMDPASSDALLLGLPVVAINEEPSVQSHTGPLSLLVVDDDPMVLKAARRILEKGGHKVMIADSGEEGLRLAVEHEPDLVVMDVVMPGLDGPATWARIRHLVPRIKVLFTSGFADKRASVPPDAPFLQKPYTLDALLTAVREVVA